MCSHQLTTERVWRACILLTLIAATTTLARTAAKPARHAAERTRTRRAAAIGPMWPSPKIAFAFSNVVEFDLEERGVVRDTLARIEESLSVDGVRCLHFVPRTAERDYILFVDEGDCSSVIGYQPGVNRISLAAGCRQPGTIAHELLHRLGFDHEHARFDRDDHVLVLANNTRGNTRANFEINAASSALMSTDTPYDFHSITHYNSDALQRERGAPTLLSKIPSLVADSRTLFYSRDRLSAIDVFKVQTLYGCKVLPVPRVVRERDSLEQEALERIAARFRIEAAFRGLAEPLTSAYLNKTTETCGTEHFWPSDYPLVTRDHPLYRLVCERKRQLYETCLFSVECQDSDAVCVRPFFKKVGRCFKIDDERLNSLSKSINDKMFQAGKLVKDKVKESIQMFKNIFG